MNEAAGDAVPEALRTLGSGVVPRDYVDNPMKLDELGSLYQGRFMRFGTLEDIEKAIGFCSQAVSLARDGDADKPGWLSNLGTSYQYRFQSLGNLADIDRAVACKSEAVSLTPDGHADKPGLLNNLGGAYYSRFERLGELTDIDQAIACQSEAVSLTPDGHKNKPTLLNNLGNSYQSRFERLGELTDIDRAIACKSQAVSLTPDGHANKPGWLNNLGNSYQRRFERLGELTDIDRAIAFQSEAVSLTPDGHAHKPGRLNNLGGAYQSRFERLGELTDIDRAIACQSEAVFLTPDGHADKPRRLNNLGNSYKSRFERLGELTDIDRAIAGQSEAVSLTPDGHADRPGRLNNLGNSYKSRFERLGELTDIDRAIECKSEAVSLAPDGHANIPGWLNNLGGSYQRRFERLGELADIDRAIECNSGAVSLTPDGHAGKPTLLSNLGSSYQNRFERLGEHADIERAILFFQLAAQSPVGHSTTRFHASRQWAVSALISNHPTTLQAYHQAMELVPLVIWLGSTINTRYEQIHSVGIVAVEAAAFAISAKQYGLALEWLEAGRSVVWSQTLQLRTQFEDLTLSAPDLANSLGQVAQELEGAGQRETSTAGICFRAAEAIAERHHRLAENYQAILAEARRLPGFENLMKSKRAADLMPATQSGPVVVINVHTSRCDALLLLPSIGDIAHVPLPELRHSDVVELHHQMQETLRSRGVRERRMHRPGPTIEDPFEGILAALWHKLVHPVLLFLGYKEKLPSEQLPHITWCTTGALSFLPIHAAGCYDESGQNVFNFAISSYTPTLSALLHSEARPREVGGILAISQENTPGCSPLPETKTELAHIRKYTNSADSLQLENKEATVEAVLSAMERYHSIHLACHGSQDPGNPTASSFHLYDGTLSLATLAKRSFKSKGMAFLSACQTAAGDERMPDEAVHLAAGMLVAGYPTVIATMWSISDIDAPLVADLVYGQLMQVGRLGEGRAARALHVAVQALRDKIGEKEFTRWVPYIHTGI